MQLDELRRTIPNQIYEIKGPSPHVIRISQMKKSPDHCTQHDSGSKTNSDFEAIKIAKKQCSSPVNYSQTIKHENQGSQDIEDAPQIPKVHEIAIDSIVHLNEHANKYISSSSGKRKRVVHSGKLRKFIEGSSRLNSAPMSPKMTAKSSMSKLAVSDSEISRSPSPWSRDYSVPQNKASSVDRILPRRKGADKFRANDDEDDSCQLTRQQRLHPDFNLNNGFRTGISTARNESDLAKSFLQNSPKSWAISRNYSLQSPHSPNYLNYKKKTVPIPLQPTENYSDDSSASGESRPSNSRKRHTNTNTRDPSIPSAKIIPHKKHVNCSGQTPLAVACARGKLELVQKRYKECPLDINVPDNAMNTPLHIASLEGWTDIVRFLVDTGKCELDCVNTVKDTPLHDAIDNGNFKVVKILLSAGANPSKPNQAGNEPLDLLNQQFGSKGKEVEVIVKEIKQAIISARERFCFDGNKNFEEFQVLERNSSHTINIKSSPQTTPTHNESHNTGSASRKAGTARSLMKTTERVLYQAFDLDALRVAARDGDLASVSRVLDVRPGLSDAKTLYNAAKGGHDAVINLLFALGDFEPDPEPANDLPIDYSTPILAAIGKDNHLEVIKLFLGNSRFNPSRKIKGEAYYDIAKRRGGPNCQKEVELFKKALYAYKKSHNHLRDMDDVSGIGLTDLETSFSSRKIKREDQPASRALKNLPSPRSKYPEDLKPQTRRSHGTLHPHDAEGFEKKAFERSRGGDDSSHMPLEREVSPLGIFKQKSLSRKSESDLTTIPEIETALKPRRKLMSGKDIKDEKELGKQRRTTSVPTTSSASRIWAREKNERIHIGPRSSSNDSPSSKGHRQSSSERESTSVRQISEAEPHRSISRDKLKEGLSANRSEVPAKRLRASDPQTNPKIFEEYTGEKYIEAPSRKKRKFGGEVFTFSKSNSTDSSENNLKPNDASLRDLDKRKGITSPGIKVKEPPNPKSERSLSVTKPVINYDKPSSNFSKLCVAQNFDGSSKKVSSNDYNTKLKDLNINDSQIPKKGLKDDKETADRVNFKREKLQLEITNRTGTNEATHREYPQQKTSLERSKHLQFEESVKSQRQAIETEAQNRAEGQKTQHQDQKVAEQQQQKDLQKSTMHEQRAEPSKTEEGYQRLLIPTTPVLLKWFNQTPDLKTTEVAKLFSEIAGYRYKYNTAESTDKFDCEDEWMLNTHAAILLGEKDLRLSRYTAWERVVLTKSQKRGVWSTCNGLFLLLDGGLPRLRKQLPRDSRPMYQVIERAKSQFLDLDLFFVKVSEFMNVVPEFPHLKGIEMAVLYREICIPQESQNNHLPKTNWQLDPTIRTSNNLIPSPKYYTDGILINQKGDTTTRILRGAPPPDIHPRRMGLSRVFPEDSDYEEVCNNRRLRTYSSDSKMLMNYPTNHFQSNVSETPIENSNASGTSCDYYSISETSTLQPAVKGA
ncbi:BgTH12-02830 [Blumeria graminis f. sp. triticale]|uniref:Bgt-4956 n=3 Tax=Blumeria graminis TaxID=34373 RepID=A0A381LCC5_BLUGR|nr:Subunit of the Set3 complex [Blumeria graminis f. sp. tritici 96224]CAD6503162.1 BgTH12-02830 [Blumeria graminis f. sp. triticale]VDB89124.1 Bgt-4956 [Blumeria graminis f. sp. tritici]